MIEVSPVKFGVFRHGFFLYKKETHIFAFILAQWISLQYLMFYMLQFPPQTITPQNNKEPLILKKSYRVLLQWIQFFFEFIVIKHAMRGNNVSKDSLLADSCTSLLITIPVLLLIMAYCCHPFWRKITRTLCDHGRSSEIGSCPDVNVLDGDPTLVLLPSGRVVVLERPRRPNPISTDFSSLDIHELEAGRLSLPQGDDSRSFASQGSKDNIQSPIQDYLPPPSYDSIFGEPITTVMDPPSYTDVISSVTFHLPESAV